MTEQFRVRVTKDYFVFSAAHFITYGDDICERLHGHNYRVAVEVSGPLEDNHYVVDFIALRDAVHAICGELDHHMLLPTGHPTIHVEQMEHEVEVKFKDRRWVFPTGDCIVLPIPNTTTELLARYIGEKLRASGLLLAEHSLRVEVDENHGQWGIWEE